MPPSAVSSLALVCQEPQVWAVSDQGFVRSSAMMEDVVVPTVAIVLAFVGFVCFVWIRTRARLQEKRFELIRELAASGDLTPDSVHELMDPKGALARLFEAGKLKSAILVVAWFGLLGGAAMTVAAIVDGWGYESREIGAAGIALGVLSLATLTAPMALAEIRRRDASA
jgi:hypothetical protein